MNMQVGNHLYHLRLIPLKVGTTIEEIRNCVLFKFGMCVCVSLFEGENIIETNNQMSYL